MFLRKALRKIFITTMSIFIIMTMYLIPYTNNKTLKTSLEFEYLTDLGNSSIYLLNDDNYLVKSKILLDDKDLTANIKTIINSLIINNNSVFPNGLKGVLPKNIKVKSVLVKSDEVIIEFNDKFKSITDKTKVLESLVYSITELKDIKKVSIKVLEEELYSKLDRSIGINKKYDINSYKNINKVVIYYNQNIDNDLYYVPVTKYLNDDRDKISIIVEELTTSYIYEPNLISLVSEDVDLISKEQIDSVMILNFNDALFNGENKIKEEVLYTLSYSVFANYDVNTTSFRVNDKEVATVKLSELN